MTTLLSTKTQANSMHTYDMNHRGEILRKRLRHSETEMVHFLSSVDEVSTKISNLLQQIRLTSQAS
jgi:hypothetical protein